MQVGIVDIKIGDTGPEAFGEITVQVFEAGPEKIRTPGFDMVTCYFTDHAIEFTIIDSGPESIFGAGFEPGPEKVEITSEVICQDQEPDLVGVPDVQDTFEVKGAGGPMDLTGGVEGNLAPGCGTIGIQRQHETGVGQRVVLKGQVGKRCITAEVGVAALVNSQRAGDVGLDIFYEEMKFDVGPKDTGVGEFCGLQVSERFFAGRG